MIKEFNHEDDMEFRPLEEPEFSILQYLISAPHWIGQSLSPHHPIFADILLAICCIMLAVCECFARILYVA